ncbi:MAG: glutamine amidotransferase-related protein, partial [Thermotogota bacterium]
MVLIVDHYDSFTYNLYQLFREEVEDVRVFRSDKISVDDIEKMDPDHIVLSPGPGKPEEAGRFIEIVKNFKDKKPLLGICLGHQAIMAEAGVPIIKAKEVFHGKSDQIIHKQSSMFDGIKSGFKAIRYHSLIVEKEKIPSDFRITALSETDEVMAVEHKRLNCIGIQFHPESIGTEHGKKLIQNFLNHKKENSSSDLIKRMMTQSLDFNQAAETMEALMEGRLDEAKIAAMMTVFNFRRITSEELAGFASVMRAKALHFPEPEKGEIRIDTCGTGGAAKKSFNVSTTAAFVLAAAGLNVVKHGNRAVTSKSGSMDLLEKLGIDIQLTPENSFQLLKKHGMAFLYAPLYHAAMKHASTTRKS